MGWHPSTLARLAIGTCTEAPCAKLPSREEVPSKTPPQYRERLLRRSSISFLYHGTCRRPREGVRSVSSVAKSEALDDFLTNLRSGLERPARSNLQ
jgi:hypothetical protein